MASENQWQKKICDGIKAEGGFGKKWATPYSVGVPDLILVPFTCTTISSFVEVKLFRACKPGWYRKVPTTLKQKEVLRDITHAGGRARVLVVVEYTKSNLVEFYLMKPEEDIRNEVYLGDKQTEDKHGHPILMWVWKKSDTVGLTNFIGEKL